MLTTSKLMKMNHAWEEHVHELAVGCTSAQLLNLGVLGGQTVIDPGQHVVSAIFYKFLEINSEEKLFHRKNISPTLINFPLLNLWHTR